MPLSVAFDATLWDAPTTGIGLYTRELATALRGEGVRVALLGAERSGDLPRRAHSLTAYALGELPSVLQTRPEPVFHAVGNFNLPLTRVKGKKFVLTVHDLIPKLLPETVSTLYRWQFQLSLFRALQVADHVVCVSERSRTDLLEHYPLPPQRVSVVYNGVDHVHRARQLDATSREYLASLNLPESYVLYAGALDARKNVALVVDAVERLRARGSYVSLVLAGQSWFGSGPMEQRLDALASKGVDIRRLGYLGAPAFYEVMRRAKVFVFPSRYEGFGLPPLEAMALGVPTIVSDAGSLPEVCGDGAVQVPVDDSEALAAELHRLLGSESARSALSERGLRRAQAFTWKKAAAAVAEVYRSLASG